jgi:hypothetical protein
MDRPFRGVKRGFFSDSPCGDSQRTVGAHINGDATGAELPRPLSVIAGFFIFNWKVDVLNYVDLQIVWQG